LGRSADLSCSAGIAGSGRAVHVAVRPSHGTSQLGALRDALVGAGASSDKAPAASGEVAAHRRDTADIRSDLRVIKWMLWFVLALQVVVAGKLLLR